jgi:Amt family ammonium transporter
VLKIKNMSRTRKILLLLLSLLIMGLFVIPTSTMENDLPINGADTAWMLTATVLVFFMTPGLSFFYGGMVSKENIISTMLQSFISLGVVSIIWVVIGFSLSFGDDIGGIIGNPFTYFMFRNVGLSPHTDFAPTFPFLIFAMFQLKFAIITPAIITGSFAERIKFDSYLIFIVLFSIFIYTPLAHMVWHPEGILRKIGILDFAGGTVVHMSAGYAALAGAIILGKRRVLKNSDGEAHNPVNIPFILLGTGMLWFGWFGFNAGSALGANKDAALAFGTTALASASGMISWILYDRIMGRKVSAVGAAIGAVIGLVAITPGAAYVTLGQSVFIGFAGSMISNIALYYKNKKGLDDTLDVFPCHGIGGISGMVLTAIFAKDIGLIYGDYVSFFIHMGALVGVSIFTFGGAYLLFKITDKISPLRVDKEEEKIGLDISQHGETYVATNYRKIEDEPRVAITRGYFIKKRKSKSS